ncbi:MAG: WD40 repeat domain-containing protein [Cyclobacteriaceae bacterium]|nr:WD40 repeat domain-containing protein [Cyclobacteriaceae bacterium]
MNRSHFFICAALATSATWAQVPNVEFLNENKDIIYDIDLADSTRLVALAPDYIATWDLSTKSIVHKYNAPGANLTCLDVSGHGEMTLFGNKQGDVTVIGTTTDEPILKKSYPGSGAVTDVKFNASDSLAAVTFYSGFFGVIDLNSKNMWEYNIPEGHAISCGFSQNGQFLAVGDDKGIVRIYNLVSHSLVNEFTTRNSLIKEIIWIEDDLKIIAAMQDGNIQTWSNPATKGQQSMMRQVRNTGTISSAGYYQETKSVYCCTLEGAAKIHFDLGTYKYREAVAMHAVRALPRNNIYITLAVATNGKGIMLVNSQKMKLNAN